MAPATSLFCRKNSLAFSRPWPRRISPTVNQAPLFLTMPISRPRSIRPPSRDALAVHDIEFGDAEWRRDLIFDHAHLCAIARHLLPLLDRVDAADVQAHGSIELESFTAGSGLRVAKHNTDLFAQLVGENDGSVGATDGA